MKHPKDLIGLKYGRLKVIKRVPQPEHLKGQRKYYLCDCDCGNKAIVAKSHLTTGHTTSCGCYMKEISIQKLDGLSDKNKTHGMSGTPFYEVWKKMKHRCYNSNNKNFHNYGGRGITVSEEWLSFDIFMNDMYDDYIIFNKTHGEGSASIERKDVNGNYCKENCTWVSMKDQQSNRRNNKGRE